jgi:hypothetical protein
MSEQVIHLKEWVKPMAMLHAQSVVEDEMGLTDQDSAEYQKEFEKAFYEFCHEFYTHSLVPHAMNPTILEGINAYVAFDDLLFDGPKSFISTNFPNDKRAKTDPKTGETVAANAEKSKQLKRSVGTIMRIFMLAKLKDIKYAYVKLEPEGEYVDTSARKKLNREAEINRFIRLFMVSTIMGAINEIYQIDARQLAAAMNEKLKNVPSGKLRNKKFNVQFANEMRELFTNRFKGKDFVGDFLEKYRAPEDK